MPQEGGRAPRRWRLWAAAFAVLLAILGLGLWVAASRLSRRFEPYIREQAIEYLRRRFDSEVELAALRVQLPRISALRMWRDRGRGSMARVEGEGIVLRHRGRRDVPPMFAVKRFAFPVDLDALFDETRTIPEVRLSGMEINVPPKGQRPSLSGQGTSPEPAGTAGKRPPRVILEHLIIEDAVLRILPRDSSKRPLQFDISRVHMEAAGAEVALRYTADLTNPKPPGKIRSSGLFGPWLAEEPAETPLSGMYTFADADLSVFRSIVGKLQSSGEFQGVLNAIHARGEARIPDFRLTMAGNPVALSTRFEVLVDGTNGNTILKPVRATLGSTHFTTSGGVLKHEGDRRRSIRLDVDMPKGNLTDVLRLAMKGAPFMEGFLRLKTKIDVPPLSGPVREKLSLDGSFEVSEARFLKSTIQEQIDQLSRRGQGQPKNEAIDEVVSRMSGRFRLDNEVITFEKLSFGVTGADVDLAGSYNLDQDVLDFHGALKLGAKVSQTMSGWKRWALKPVDPFFSKKGAGTFLRIQVTGSSRQPRFGRDKGDKAAP